MNRSCLLELLLVVFVSACGGISPSIREYASELPSRAKGQYALIDDDDVRKQLVLKDSELQCRIDLDDKKSEAESSACSCAKSASNDWKQDCNAWLAIGDR